MGLHHQNHKVVLVNVEKFTFLQDSRNTLSKPVLCAEAVFVKGQLKAYFSLAKKMSFKDFGDIFCGSNSYELGEKNHMCKYAQFLD